MSEQLPASVKLGTKAETLLRLAPHLRHARIQPQVCFLASDWIADPAAILRSIEQALPGSRLVVRSSAHDEDTEHTSNAGAYASVLGVASDDVDAIRAAVEEVVASYPELRDGDQVLVQRQLESIALCGVLCTRELTTLAPYSVFNYDCTGSSDSVTSGRGDGLENYTRFRNAALPPPADLAGVFEAVAEIEQLVGSDRLEIELAIDDDGQVWIFQVRPLAVRVTQVPAEATVADHLEKTAKKIRKLSAAHPHLLGTRSLFGVMPDWNPAEIIGFRPRTLALTLYKELVTDAIWAYQRDNYGYRNLRSFPLLVSFLGIPYIDVRVSFNSFVPKAVSDPLAEKLVNHYVERLIAAPHNHDKVEFEIVHSCVHPGIEGRMRELADAGFDASEIEELRGALAELTARVVDPRDGLYLDDLRKIEELDVRRERILDSEMSRIDKIYWLIEDCKRWGTLPFSGLARAAFIATEFLNGLRAVGVFSARDVESLFRSLDTVTNRFQTALGRLKDGDPARSEFLAEYGHLRPGTYDILSRRYDEAFDAYFGSLDPPGAADENPFELSQKTEKRVGQALEACGLDLSPRDCLAFVRRSIEGREWAKLVFTRNVSAALVLIGELGAQCGLSREELSHLNARRVLELYSSLDALDLREILLRDIEANRRAFEVTSAIQLPPLIVSEADVYHFHVPAESANFVTSKTVSADVVREEDIQERSLEGKIVFLASADPGYDWLFSRRIAGLITMFGGANSHMAVRSAEQGLPAVIGCGKAAFERWSRAQHLQVDCARRSVVVVR